jgi:site-specific recombinase XerD
MSSFSRDAYRRDREDLIAWFAEQQPTGDPMPVDRVERRDLEGYLASLDSRGLAGSYRRRKVAAIRSFFGFLYQQGFVARSPAAEPKDAEEAARRGSEERLEHASPGRCGKGLGEAVELTVVHGNIPSRFWR